MTNIREHAEQLLEEFNWCVKARPKHDAVAVQLEKDAVGKWAVHLNNQLGWGTENEIAEACYQLEPRLNSLKEKIVFEVLKHGI
jgi:hypothetical protein